MKFSDVFHKFFTKPQKGKTISDLAYI